MAATVFTALWDPGPRDFGERAVEDARERLQGRQQGFWSRQRLARTSAEVSTLLTSLTLPATSLT